VPFARRSTAADLELVNPGSVGMPFGGDQRAACALAHENGSLEHRRVAYDHASVSARLRRFGAGWAEVVALRIERATMDV
jgi:diadenosine tetraphosphatase ApaH/serine/threonine PP2A family protein phosphatase